MTNDNYLAAPDASLLRQLAAMIYDSLLIFAVLFFAGSLAIAINGGEAIEHSLWFKAYLLFTVFTYYAWFWKKSGQTLGMRAWKIRIITETGANPGWMTGYRRLAFALLSWACLGIGYLWRLFRPWTWHDRLSGTRIVIAPPQ